MAIDQGALGIITGDANGVYPITSDINVRLIRGRITPCDGCKRRYYCAMYFSFTRNRLRSQYMNGTNILHHCKIYIPDRIPQKIGRTNSYAQEAETVEQN